MKAVGFYHDGNLEDVTVQQPEPAERQLLVKIKAVSVNPVDTKQFTAGVGQFEEPRILGYDAAGVVERVGDGVKQFQEGDEVYYAGDVTKLGTNSEYHLVDERIVAKKPRSLSFSESAAVPLTTITAREALFDRMGVKKQREENAGKRLLIVGAAGGVGSMAIQIAKWAGLSVTATASRKETKKWVHTLGADHVIDHGDILADGQGLYTYVLCCTHLSDYWEIITAACAPQGNICSIVAEEPLDLSLLKTKSITFSYEFMFTRSMYETDDQIAQHELLTEAARLFDEGVLKSTVQDVYSPINAQNLTHAHEKLKSGRVIGKIVVESF
ncbi:zinc-containing alcohol dehydrogenase [Geomicrobium sp. JCM 19037]|uniref:zinc-binding alcohol dehydrogenase family protein n=1 Tax=Geomicrobium sp. JCM 19037 TaxID=1460634 RepID=UPI00045F1F85|nr:zinc-binding alcohol dehydrogenase family protein [Geomicrobium sp. JCM 19037]GAK03570.1 zinc-containing alcohol dehydrogenase [Geomicrobium sp. JCM 19037]